LILASTRELAAQIAASFTAYGRFTGLRCTVVFGGVSQKPQVHALQAGVDILVATPGRLCDLMNQGYVDLSRVAVLILDEADQMLDMGFLPDLRRIVAAVPRRRQTLMFSATMPEEIRQLADRWLCQPEYVHVGPVATPVQQVMQSVYMVESRNKPQLLEHLLRSIPATRTLVFARTKHGADKIVRLLVRSGIRAVAIHGNKSQNVRTRTLEQFKSQEPPVLVATDIAARGLDVKDISHVINYELPEVPEIYVHRIGRTARATGTAVSFCSRDEHCRLQLIERLTRQTIGVKTDHPQYTDPRAASAPSSAVELARPVSNDRPAPPRRRTQHAAYKPAASARRHRHPTGRRAARRSYRV
jgi:ATP-dependent RNA helicase RhlE